MRIPTVVYECVHAGEQWNGHRWSVHFEWIRELKQNGEFVLEFPGVGLHPISAINLDEVIVEGKQYINTRLGIPIGTRVDIVSCVKAGPAGPHTMHAHSNPRPHIYQGLLTENFKIEIIKPKTHQELLDSIPSKVLDIAQ